MSAVTPPPANSPELAKVPRRINSNRHNPPVISPWLLKGFLAYAPHYLRKQFHSVQATGTHHLQAGEGRPTVIYMNHASWWDPMIAALLAERFLKDRLHYTPIDAAALEKYKFFARIGFFGIESHRLSGARKFLDIGSQLLRQSNSVLWITPQGRFADVRQRPLGFERGLADLLLRGEPCHVVPVAIEYAHWEERTAEVLVRIAEPVVADRAASAGQINLQLETHLEQAMDELAQASIQRNLTGFTSLLHGRTGVGGVYDGWRSLKAMFRGEEFSTVHGKHP